MDEIEFSADRVAQVRECIVGTLSDDMALNCNGGVIETSLLASWFREGVRGFQDFTNEELLGALTDACLDDRYQRESNILRFAILSGDL